MNYDEIRQFQGLTGLESFDEINYWLEMGGKSLENALELYFAHMNMGNSSVASSSSSIRKPDQVKRARLVSEVDDISKSVSLSIVIGHFVVGEKGRKRRKETVAFSNQISSHRHNLATWYAPPQDLLTYEAFEVVSNFTFQLL